MSEAEIGRLPVSQKLGWSVGAAGVSILMNGVTGVILFYLVSILKMDPALAGALIFAFKLVDVVTDPLMGIISDRTRSKMGRRRPYLLIGTFISTISLLVLFGVPEFDSELATALYVSLGLLLYTLGYTIFNVPYITMPAEMTDGYHERSSIHAYRVVFVSTGSTAATVIGLILLEQFGQNRETYFLVAAIKAALVFATMLTCFLATRGVRTVARTEAIPRFWKQATTLLENRYFLLVISAKMLQLLGIFSTQAALYFFVLSGLQLNESALIAFFLSTTAASLLFSPLLVHISKRLGKRNTYIIGGLVYAAVALSWYLAEAGEPLWLIMLRGFLIGLPFAGNILLARSMLTDTIDYDYRRTGIRREGIYTAMYSFVEKFAGAFGPLLIGVLLAQAGFDQDLAPKEAQRPEVVAAMLLGIGVIPALTSVLAAVVISFNKLDQKTLEATRPIGETMNEDEPGVSAEIGKELGGENPSTA